jgi:hypothetical protein
MREPFGLFREREKAPRVYWEHWLIITIVVLSYVVAGFAVARVW